MEHDEIGCKHSGCDCRITQQIMMGEKPSRTLRASRVLNNAVNEVVDHIPIENYNELIFPEKTFVQEYPDIEPQRLFEILVECLKSDYRLKVWKVDDMARTIDASTHPMKSVRLIASLMEQVDIIVLEGQNSLSSVLQFKITPTTMGLFVGSIGTGVTDRTADAIAKIIFEDLNARLND